LNTTGSSCLTVLEATSLKSRCWRSHVLPKALGSILPCSFQHMVASDIPAPLQSLLLSLWGCSSVDLFKGNLLLDFIAIWMVQMTSSRDL
jgi:hypothetical protein